MALKYGQILVIATLGALTLGSFSVMGLLQSTERIGATGLIVRPAEEILIIQDPISNPSLPPPEPEVEIDVYQDQDCTKILSDVVWGEIEAGGYSDVPIYVMNKGDTSLVVTLASENWSSSVAESNMDVSWDYNGTPLESGDVRMITLRLSVDPDCPELEAFGFDLVIIGS